MRSGKFAKQNLPIQTTTESKKKKDSPQLLTPCVPVFEKYPEDSIVLNMFSLTFS